jgi:hypothetical protein
MVLLDTWLAYFQCKEYLTLTIPDIACFGWGLAILYEAFVKSSALGSTPDLSHRVPFLRKLHELTATRTFASLL